MGRIPEAEIERLKREVSVLGLAQERGVVLKQHGDELLGLCPFHDDKEPSLVINPGKNLWHCLGACQKGGSVIDWVMMDKKVEFRDAVGILKNLTPNPFPQREWGPERRESSAGSPRLSGEGKSEKDMKDSGGEVLGDSEQQPAAQSQKQLNRVIDFYHETLKKNPDALAYLKKRGIDKGIDRFKLGFCDRSYCQGLPSRQTKEGKRIREDLIATGILRKSGHEHFRGSLVIPVIDDKGVITEVYGRKTSDAGKLTKGTPVHLYLPGPHRGVWNVEAFLHSSEIILCESLIDALTFWCAGYGNVTCSYGIEGFTSDHMEAFRLYGIEKVLIAYDRDEAGDKAALALADKLIDEEGMECFRIQFPKGMDANEYALKVTPASKSLGLCIRKAVWMGKGKAPENHKPSPEKSSPEKPSHEKPSPLAPLPKLGEGNMGEHENTSVGRGLLREGSELLPEIKNGEVTIKSGDRRWRVRGLEKCLSFDSIRVNILVSKEDGFYVDTFDLYNARHRLSFIKQAAEELQLKEDVVKKDLGRVLLKLEELQEKQINKVLNPEKKEVKISEEDKTEALKLLKDPKLLDRILDDFEKCGVVGERTNKLVGYLSACSRKLERPLAIIIQSSSAAGKSALMESILSFFPLEEQVKYSAMTGQSLFYMGETNLKHKILSIAEEEGAEKASYALKLLQSEGELTIASTGKDPSTGRLETQEYHVEGPVMIFLTTTAIEIDEELLNRCIVLSVDENREQTRAIHDLQRFGQTLEGLLAHNEKSKILKLHQNAQRLLRPILVANPFAKSLTFLDNQTRSRRDHMKYLTLIRAITLLHQYQRPLKSVTRNGKEIQYIEVTPGDIEIANRLSHKVLGRSLDELAPQTRRLLVLLDEMIETRCKELEMERVDFRFSRKEIREYGALSYDQVRVHLERLVNLEYVLVHHGGRGQSFEYELVFDGDFNVHKQQMMGLIDVKNLKTNSTMTSLGGETAGFGGGLGAHLPPIGVPLGGEQTGVSTSNGGGESAKFGISSQNAHLDNEKNMTVVPYIGSGTDDV